MFDFLRRGAKPEPPATADAVGVQSPVAGRLVPLADVPDPVFSGGLVGPGFAVDPADGTVRAPIDGTVVTLPDSLHAVGIRHEGGVEVLVHVGVDTVGLKGRGFRALCTQGQQVRAGDPILEVDLVAVGAAVPSLLTPVIVTSDAGGTVSDADLAAPAGAPVVLVRSS